METLILNVTPKHMSRNMLLVQRLVMGAMGCINLLNAIFIAGTFRYVNLVTGVGCLVVAVWFRHNPKTSVFSFSDAGIEKREGQKSSVLLPWVEVAYFEYSPLRLTIAARNGQLLDIDLGSLSYQQHKTIKPQILRFAKAFGVEAREN
jgi:hypothetical protein